MSFNTTGIGSDDTSVQKVRVSKAASLIGTRREINFIEGSNVTLTVADDPVNNRVDLTIAATGSSSSEFADNVFRITDNGDSTKKLAIECSGISTGTVRTWTVPNASSTFVGTDTTQTLTNKTLTTPVVDQINDTNGNESVKFTATSSAVNEFTIVNAATGNAPDIQATGGDTDINIKLTPKGAGGLETTANILMKSGTSASEFRFYEPSGSGTNYTAFKAQAQSGNVTYTLPAADGTSGYFLKTDGSGVLSWASAGGGGGGSGIILQVVNATTNTYTTNATNSYTDTGLTASITPTDNNNKILVLVDHVECASTSSQCNLQLLRGASSIWTGTHADGGTGAYTTVSLSYLDSPASTSAQTYKTQFKNGGGGTASVCRAGGTSTITLLEVSIP